MKRFKPYLLVIVVLGCIPCCKKNLEVSVSLDGIDDKPYYANRSIAVKP